MSAEEGENGGPRVGIHVAGGADVWAARPAEHAERMASFLAVKDADDQVRYLTTVPPGYPYREPAVACLLKARLDVLVLVATDQDRSGADAGRPADTVEVGRRLAVALERCPSAFGVVRTIRTKMVAARALGLDDVREPIAEVLRALSPSAVVMSLGSGATGAFAGAMLAALEVGHVPQVVSQSLAGVVTVGARVNLRRWLARNRHYRTLAEIDKDHAAAWQALACYHGLDWRALDRSAATDRGGQVETVGEVRVTVPKPPPPGAGAIDPPPDDDWPYYAEAIESSMLARFGCGDLTSGLHLVRPWLETSIRARLLGDPARAETLRRMGLGHQPEGRRADWVPELFRGRTQLPDGPIRRFLTRPGVGWLLERSLAADHGEFSERLSDGAEALLRSLAAELDGPDQPPFFEGDEHLIVICLGLQVERVGEIASALSDHCAAHGLTTDRAHVRLVHSQHPNSGGAAETLARQLAETRMAVAGRVRAIGPVADRDPQRVHRDCRRALLGQVVELAGVGHVWFVLGPGRSEMNLGALLAAIEWAVQQGAVMRVGQLLDRPTRGSEVHAAPHRVIARLAQDRTVERVTSIALDALDFDLARRMLDLGSLDWQPLKDDVGALRELLFGRQAGPAAVALLKRAGAACVRFTDGDAWRRALFPARAHLIARLAPTDSWRALYLICAIAESTWDRQTWRQGGSLDSPGAWLWRHRNDSPYGHRVWALPPDGDQVARRIEDLADSARDPARVAVAPPATLVRVRELLKQEAARVSERLALREPKR